MPLFLLGATATFATVPKEQRAFSGVFVAMAIFMPLFYAVLGFIIATLCAWVYNLIAGRFGGLELDFHDVSPRDSAALPS